MVEDGEYEVYTMVIWGREWLEELWRYVQQFRALFWDESHAELENFVNILFQPGWMFFEVYKFGQLIGLFYLTNMDKLTDIQLHGIAFDRKLTDKIPLLRKLLVWVFENYPIERVEVSLNGLPRATMRFIERVGFVHEGTRRKGVIFRSRWRDQHIYSVTREEVCLF